MRGDNDDLHDVVVLMHGSTYGEAKSAGTWSAGHTGEKIPSMWYMQPPPVHAPSDHNAPYPSAAAGTTRAPSSPFAATRNRPADGRPWIRPTSLNVGHSAEAPIEACR